MTRVSRGRIKRRTWTWQGKKRTAWYFDVVSNGERVCRQYASQTEAETELDDFREEQRNPTAVERVKLPKPILTLAEAIERYLAAKARKRTVAEDKRSSCVAATSLPTGFVGARFALHDPAPRLGA